MGIIVYFHDKKSVTNTLFFLMSLSAVFWSLANYFSITADSGGVLSWVRWVLFFAVPLMTTFFLFILNFPEVNSKISRKYLVLISIGTFFVMISTISPFVFSGYRLVNEEVVPVAGPLMPLFGGVVLGYLIASLVMMIIKFMKAKDLERKQWKVMVVGVFTTFFLLIITNYLFVVLFDITFFVKLGPLFMLPAIFGMGYAIMKHHLLNVKAIATEILTFAILSISLFEVFAAERVLELVLRIGVFSLFFFFGILLIRSVLREVEQRERLEILTRELGEANEKLKELDHLKSEFLSFASHQIKAPLAAIKGFATFIYDGTYGDVSEKVKEAAHKIKDSADRMVKLVGDFLSIRKIEEGKMDYKFEKMNAASMVKDIFEELKPLAQNKKLDFTLGTVSDGGWISADVQKIRQVFQNLIENAIKYTDSGFVKVAAEAYGGQFLFSVSDSGHGISKELLPHLFEEFKRDTASKKIEGTGLGLFIARDIVLAHHGDIWVESDGPGKGSKFIVKMPLV